jgi:thymidylate kinase
LADAVRRSLRRSSYLVRRAVGRPARRQRLLCGGLVVAVLGGDGAGKTTTVSHLTEWLSCSLETRGMHLGKPPRSLATLAVAIARRLARWTQVRRWLGLSVPDEPSPLLLHLRALCIARDRYELYRRARREAARGRIVICDRYPTSYIRGMDGPSTMLPETTSSNWLTRRIRQAESRMYDRILAPELAIVLRVDPEVAVARKTDEDAEYVRARSSEVWRLDLREAPVHVLDANRPCADVLADARRVVWTHL